MIELQDIGPPGPPTAVYVHVPFCRDRCVYCAFPTVPDDPSAHAALVDAVLLEAAPRREGLPPLTSLYLGGGTPGLLAPAELQRLLAGLPSRSSGAELTLEVNPANVDSDALSSWSDLGINRVSIGIQTFRDDVLKMLARRHDGARASQALALLATDWPRDWTADLLVGWTGQGADDADLDVRRLLEFEPPHVSVYGLTVEPLTILARQQASGVAVTAPPDSLPDLDDAWSRRLETAGLERYEVSNFARGGGRSRHNQAYWTNRSYLGFGPGAASSVHPLRWSNERDPAAYQRLVQAGRSARAHAERLTPEQRLLESLAIGLRTLDGLELAELDRRFGAAWRPLVEQAAREALPPDTLQWHAERLFLAPRDLVKVDRITAELAARLPRDRNVSQSTTGSFEGVS